MTPVFLRRLILGSIAAALFLAGCATDQPQKTRRYVWPRLPEQPRIEWLKSYYDQHDFPKSNFESAVEFLFGKAEARTFEKPIDIKSNGSGRVYVTDVALSAILVYDLVNFEVKFWERAINNDKALSLTPFYISLDRNDNVYVVGQGESNIQVLDKQGAVINKIDFTGKVKSPAGIAVDDATGRVYLVDAGDGKIEVFELSGKHLFSFGKPGEGDGEFNRPSPITINRKGEIVVGDVMNARIQIFDRQGKFLRKFGKRGDSGGEFQIIKGVAVDSDDNVYVTDGKANQIKIFSYKGDYLMAFGSAYSVTRTLKEAPGGFLLPQGIHIDATDTIYITDQANMRFQVFKYLKEGSEAGSPALVPARPVK